MKRIIEIVLFLMIIELTLGQQQLCFAINPSSKWKVSITENSMAADETIVYYINSDTMINSGDYHKLFKSGIFYFDEPYYYSHVYAGALRDSENKFYFIKKEETSEILLFDFNLKLGDTIRSEIGKGRIVNKVDTLPNGRRRFYSFPSICGGCCPVPVLIEGIGHFGGLLEDPPCNHIGFHQNKLLCYSENGNIIYQKEKNPGYNCDLSVSAPDIPKNNISLNIYPVPAKDLITIECSDIKFDIADVKIYNVQGIEILSKKVNNIRATHRINLDVSGLEKGIYVLKIGNENSYLTQRLVKE